MLRAGRIGSCRSSKAPEIMQRTKRRISPSKNASKNDKANNYNQINKSNTFINHRARLISSSSVRSEIAQGRERCLKISEIEISISFNEHQRNKLLLNSYSFGNVFMGTLV